MKNIQLNKPKKIHSDKDITIFRDRNGHEIRVAHAALSPKMLKELQSLPMHDEKPKKMASGGDPSDDTIPIGSAGSMPSPEELEENETSQAQLQANERMAAAENLPYGMDMQYGTGAPIGSGDSLPSGAMSDQSIPVNIPGVSGQTQQAEAGPSPASVSGSDEDQSEDESENENIPPPEQQPNPVPQTPLQSVISTPLDANTIANTLNQQNAQLYKDFSSGKIQPKTLSSIWSTKDDGTPRGTLSKIGMFFSMLASGMGSGLTHQPNQLLAAMQKQIDNDLQAQQNTKTNQLNAWNMANQHAQTLSTINLQTLQGKLAQAQAQNQPILAQQYQSEIELNKKNAQLVGTNNARALLWLGALQQAENLTQKSPPGPMKNQMAAAHQALGQYAQADMMKNSQQTGAQIESAWNQRNMLLSAMPETQGIAQWQAERHIPGQSNYTSVPVTPQDRQSLAGMQALDSQIDAIQGFIGNHPLGELTPAQVQRGKQMAAEIVPLYSQSLGGDLSQGRTEWLSQQIKDNPAGLFSQLAGAPARLQEIKDANERRRESVMNKYYVPGGYTKSNQSSGTRNQSASNDGTEVTTKSGRRAVWRNGQLVYK